MSFLKDAGVELPLAMPKRPRSGAFRILKNISVFCLVVGLISCTRNGSLYLREFFGRTPLREASCPQLDPLTPRDASSIWKDIGEEIHTEDFKGKAVHWLSNAVKIPTESYDDMGDVGEDSRWEAFGPFHDYLRDAFPNVHQSLSLKKVNTYGLLYEWTGRDTSLKPLLLAAHQDVVPVDPNTLDDWAHPPYSGHFDGERIWGRGSSDDKSGLIGILSALETLIVHGFKPTRTIVIASGFDEEVSGTRGAYQLSRAMLDAYGEDAFAMIVDEGGGFTDEYGSMFATPGVAEKGYMDTRLEVATLLSRGHSSVPPSHTSIGILAALLAHYEKHPAQVHLSRDSVVYDGLQCFAEHGSAVPRRLKKAIKRSVHSNLALHALEHMLFKDNFYKALLGTTQAIDLIGGGVKTNALPENAWAVVNHRIATDSSVEDTKERDTKLLEHLAHEFNLTYTAFGSSISDTEAPSSGSLVLSEAFGHSLNPAPVTPTKGEAAAPYNVLSGTIRATYNAYRAASEDNIVVAPTIPTGNTDTRYYWKLSSHIFRYNHKNNGYSKRGPNNHTVNESIVLDTFLEMILFFTTLILNTDEAML